MAAFAYLLWQHDTELAVCTLGAYLVELVAQLVSESVYIKQGRTAACMLHCSKSGKSDGVTLHECHAESVMWPQVPQVYQTYRVWQLIRGCYLTSALGGPDWLWAMQAGLILLWVFNFGAVMTWTPWMYRWQLQPDNQQESSTKSK